MKVLVVEDEPLTAFVLKDELENAGHEVIGPVAELGDALLLARRHRPDLALLEIELEGGFAGLDLARELTRLDIPCVYATAQSTLARANSGCAIGYLAKPFNPTGLAEIVRAIEQVVAGKFPTALLVPPSLEFFGRLS